MGYAAAASSSAASETLVFFFVFETGCFLCSNGWLFFYSSAMPSRRVFSVLLRVVIPKPLTPFLFSSFRVQEMETLGHGNPSDGKASSSSPPPPVVEHHHHGGAAVSSNLAAAALVAQILVATYFAIAACIPSNPVPHSPETHTLLFCYLKTLLCEISSPNRSSVLRKITRNQASS
jgi:hypothetical protein